MGISFSLEFASLTSSFDLFPDLTFSSEIMPKPLFYCSL